MYFFFNFIWKITKKFLKDGKLVLYQSGLFLRGRYGPFLGALYSPDLYYAEATDVDRTKASLQVVNAGLWPPKGAQKWGPLDWQPIPIHSQPLEQDSVSEKIFFLFFFAIFFSCF